MATITQLNKILGERLGYNPYGEPLWKWAYSEDLFWPALKLNTKIAHKLESGLIVMKTDYRQDRMTHKYVKSWLIVAWKKPEELTSWETLFPSAPYPSRGYYIHTNWVDLPGTLPSLRDTELFVERVKAQLQMSEREFYEKYDNEKSEEDRASLARLEDMVAECLPMSMNGTQGKRGGDISFQSGFGDSPVLQKSGV